MRGVGLAQFRIAGHDFCIPRCRALALALLLTAGCQTSYTPGHSFQPRFPDAVVTSRLTARSSVAHLLIWPMRNDAAADLLVPSDLAMLRIYSAQRDQVAAQLAAELLVDMDEEFRRAPLAAGIELLPRVGDPQTDLEVALTNAGADALLTGRITRWERLAPGREDTSTVHFSAEILLLSTESSEPLWSWSVTNYPLCDPARLSVRKQAASLMRQAGRSLVEAIEAAQTAPTQTEASAR